MEEVFNEIPEEDIQTYNEWAGYFSLKPNFIKWALSRCNKKMIGVFTGNQAGKTANIVRDYIDRILGLHPIEEKNMRPNTPIRVIRFASQTLPTESETGGEIRNTIYPQFRTFFPYHLIKKDITARRPAITIRDPQLGNDIVVEFVSYGQEVQSQAGHQRWSIFLDEESPMSFYEEQLPRLIASHGDMVIGLTPTESLTWTFENIYERASEIYNSSTIIKYLKKRDGITHKVKELIDRNSNIAVIRAATDDNPTLDIKDIEEKYSGLDDVTREIRRYGIFHQISGVIYKEYDPGIHFISRNKYFPEGIPYTYLNARGIDFHEFTNWACGWIALSPDNEAFIWEEYNPSPGRMVTREIAREIAVRSQDYHYPLNLIDPWAAKTQVNTGQTCLDDLNRAFHEFKREGLGSGGYWQTWDTKNLRGRDIVKERLQNSRKIGKPFNNRIVKDGVESYLPTLWVLDNCIHTNYGFRNWRQEQWASRESLITKEEKNKAQDKYSHFPITYECIFKNDAFRAGRFRDVPVNQRRSGIEHYMQPRW